VYFLALRELRSAAAAEDVTNETLLRVMQAVREDRLQVAEALPGFVAGTARNVIQEYRRKESRTTALGDRDAEAPRQEPVDHTVRRAIQLVLERMKPRERELLRLYYYEELSKEEIGTQLGIDPERVRLVKSRALKSFREFYDRLKSIGKA